MMNYDLFHEGLFELKKSGLNSFSSLCIEQLPEEIKHEFQKLTINLPKEGTLCLIANGGKDLWQNFTTSPNADEHPDKHPIDKFCVDKMKDFAKNYLQDEITILFPHPSYCLPLQKLARAFNLSRPSLLGIDINPHFGVWFGIRGVFITSKKFDYPLPQAFNSPCDDCSEKPCLSSCPANALALSTPLNFHSCSQYRLAPLSPCADRCLARETCPYQAYQAYSREQIQYHSSISKKFLVQKN